MPISSAIIIFRTSNLGDFIMTAPALRLLRVLYPNDKIILITLSSSNKAMRDKISAYAGNDAVPPTVKLVMPHLVDDCVVMSSALDWNAIRFMRKDLRKYRVRFSVAMSDVAAPWPGRIKKWILMKLIAPLRPVYGLRWPGARNKDNSNVETLYRKGALKHHVDGLMQVFHELPTPYVFQPSDILFDLRPGPEAQQKAQTLWADHGLLDRPVLAVAPGAVTLHKRWPPEQFKALITAVLDRFPDLKIVVMGAPNDAELGVFLQAADPDRVVNFIGVSSIPETAAILSSCVGIVGNDGGAMHLGAAMGCPAVAIMPGIEYPNSVEPWGNVDRAIRHPVPCAPCYSFDHCPEGHNKCMLDAPFKAVFDKTAAMLCDCGL